MARHSREHIRHHRARMIAKRKKTLSEYPSNYYTNGYWRPDGYLAKKAPFDCGVSKCRCCHPDFFQNRSRDKRDWQKFEAAAW